MTRLFAYFCTAGSLILLAAGPSWGQKPAAPPTSSGGNVGAPPPVRQPSSSLGQSTYVSGRVLMETGQPVPEPVAVGLFCGLRSLRVINTDLKGYFEIVLGGGAPAQQDDTDFSASDPGTDGLSNHQGNISGGNMSGNSGMSLAGCELRVSVPGYQPLTRTISDPASLGTIDVGTLRLARLSGVVGSAISVTSLLVPNNARKEFDQGEKDARNNHLQSATQHLEKAVAVYPKYAAAWSELGSLYGDSHKPQKAQDAFEKAVAADSNYIPPYVGLGYLQLENQKFEDAVETAGRALQLDPGNESANFIQAVGNFDLHRLDAAEKSAREAQKGPENMPQLHALLADIFVQKQDYANASAEMRAYLQQAPTGPYADQMKKNLQQMAQSPADGTGESNPLPAQPPAAAPN